MREAGCRARRECPAVPFGCEGGIAGAGMAVRGWGMWLIWGGFGSLGLVVIGGGVDDLVGARAKLWERSDVFANERF